MAKELIFKLELMFDRETGQMTAQETCPLPAEVKEQVIQEWLSNRKPKENN